MGGGGFYFLYICHVFYSWQFKNTHKGLDLQPLVY